MRVTRDMIDPQLRLPGAVFAALLGTERTVGQLRKDDPSLLKLIGKLPLRGVRKTEEHIPRDDGGTVRLVILSPPREPTTPGPAILWIHGGGYAGGSVESELAGARDLVRDHAAVVVSPDYRLSKHAPFPAARDDCYAALLWLKQHATALGANVNQIVVIGSSAGGGLTAAISLYARDHGDVNIAFQCPMYPMIDDRETCSSKDNNAPIWDGATNQNAWRMYLGHLYGGDVPAYAAPARATNYHGLPPTITFVGDIEPFRDETIAYAHALATAGVSTELLIVPGAWHGFNGLARWTRPAKTANAWYKDKLSLYLARHTAPQPQ